MFAVFYESCKVQVAVKNAPAFSYPFSLSMFTQVIVFLTYSKSAGAMSHLYVSRNYGASFNAITLPLTPGKISRASHLQPALAAKDWVSTWVFIMCTIALVPGDHMVLSWAEFPCFSCVFVSKSGEVDLT